jgi:tryptophan 2,3-dioxygenase
MNPLLKHLIERLSVTKGSWFITKLSQCIRHKGLADRHGNALCPLNYLATVDHYRNVLNHHFDVFEKCFAADFWTVRDVIRASDNEFQTLEHSSQVRILTIRYQLMEVLGL